MYSLDLHPIQLVCKMAVAYKARHVVMRYYKIGQSISMNDVSSSAMEAFDRGSENNPYEVFHHNASLLKDPQAAFASFHRFLKNRKGDRDDYLSEAHEPRRCIGWEFGFQGLEVRDGEGVMPGIDFSTQNIEHAFGAAAMLSKQHLKGVPHVLYATGRSFHAYYPVLVPFETWQAFMGTCTNFPTVIDQDWVRIKRQQKTPALRWSNATEKHTTLPTAVQDANGVLEDSYVIDPKLFDIMFDDTPF